MTEVIETEGVQEEAATTPGRKRGRPRISGAGARRGRRPANHEPEESPAKILAREIAALARAASSATNGDGQALMRMLAERADRMETLA